MSIVPYNTNHQILFHDPNEGILIVRNSKQNTVQLVSTAVSTSDASSNRNQPNEQFNSNRFPNNGPSNTHKCPNCGFTWPEYSPASGHRNPSDSSSNMTTIDPSESVALAKTFPKGFMHHDYFKFLGKLEYNESTSSSIPYHSLPADIFNQGYFKRFFKKVPPFTLGSGAHAQVYKVIHVLNEIKLGTYAVKRISIGNQFEMLEQVLNEVLILYELSVKGANENNLIRYNHVWLELGDIDDSSTFCLPDGDNIPKDIKTQVPYVFILQQYCGGGHLEDLVVGNFQKENQYSWKDKIELERQKRRASRGKAVPIEENKRKWLTELEIWKFFTDVANGVNYLHLHGILHRDLKPSNCLLDVKFKIAEEPQVFFDTVGECDDELEKLPKVLVSDFGEGQIIDKRNILETNISEIRNESANERRGNTGTLEFTAPELWLFSNYDPALGDENKKFINDFSYESDIYSLGLILCYLCCGKLPFSDLLNGELDPQNIKNKIIEWYFDLTPESFHVWFSNSAKFEDDGFDSPSTCFYDFENLIYSMIKGDENDGDKGTSSRATSTEVIGVLQTMRWERFIKERE
ncbi:kinase-like domain-containing protein, partial [Scheffersomyces xylosifermentans]|uniref:kinase-like domain-containing protein n=1 Tax=Scheffersomyces xylosifermentans TaxID=1304137 RepID=UPI00315C86BB